MVSVSVVIPSRNAGPLFREVLSRLREQEYPGGIEIVVIDSGSTDATLELASEYGAVVRSIPPSEFDHGLTRNRGIELASGEIIVLMSQDAVPGDRDLVRNFVRAFEDPKIAGAYARQVPRSDADIITKRNLGRWLTGRKAQEVRWIQDWDAYRQMSPMQRHRFYNFDDVCSAIRRDVWRSIPFRAQEFGEDIDWSQRALEAGWKIAYWPSSFVVHSHPRSIRYEYRRNFQTLKKLYAQYRLCTVPTWASVISTSLRVVVRDLIYAIRHERRPRRLLETLIRVPALGVALVYGQYRGAMEAKREISRLQPKSAATE